MGYNTWKRKEECLLMLYHYGLGDEFKIGLIPILGITFPNFILNVCLYLLIKKNPNNFMDKI